MLYLHTKFHISNANGSFLIAMKMKAKEIFRTAAKLLFHIIQKP